MICHFVCVVPHTPATNCDRNLKFVLQVAETRPETLQYTRKCRERKTAANKHGSYVANGDRIKTVTGIRCHEVSWLRKFEQHGANRVILQ